MKKLFKMKKLWLTIGVLILLSIAYGIGNNSAKVTLDESKVNYAELTSKIKDLESESKKLEKVLDDTKKEIQDEQSKLDEKSGEVSEALALVDSRDDINSEIEKLSKDLDGKIEKIDSLDKSIESNQSELEKLKNGVAKKKEDPVELISGVFIVGKDLPPSRYQATNIGRGSNFVVYDSDGSLKVNTILGNDFGSGDYVFFANEGDVIETSAKVKLIPVK